MNSSYEPQQPPPHHSDQHHVVHSPSEMIETNSLMIGTPLSPLSIHSQSLPHHEPPLLISESMDVNNNPPFLTSTSTPHSWIGSPSQNSSVIGFLEKFNHLLHHGDDIWSEAAMTNADSFCMTQISTPNSIPNRKKNELIASHHLINDGSDPTLWENSSVMTTTTSQTDANSSIHVMVSNSSIPNDSLVDHYSKNSVLLEPLDLLKLGNSEIWKIFEFLIGDVQRAKSEMNSQFYWNIIHQHLHGHESEHDALLALFNVVPPKESVLSLRYLCEMNKRTGKIFSVNVTRQDGAFFEFWKLVYVHFEKILCVFRSLIFTNMTLAMGRISWYEREQLANMQRLIVAHEMGTAQPLKVGETLEQFDDQVELIDPPDDEFFSSEHLQNEFLQKFKRLELTPLNEQFILQHHEDGMFNLAIFKMLQLSLKMFRDFDLDFKDLALPNNFRNSHVRFEMDIFNERTRKLGFCMDYNSSYQFEVESEDEQDELIKNLSKFVILDLRDVTNFSKYLDFTLPSEIQFLNFCSSIPYNYDLGNVKFSNVKYLRINIEGSHHECDVGEENLVADYGHEPVFIEDTTSMFLTEMLSTKRFPNLIHLVLRGAQSLSFLEEESESGVLSQLWFLELLINDDHNGFYGSSQCVETLRKVTSRMPHLKQLVLNVNLDVRRSSGIDYEKLKDIYRIGNGRFTVSVGRASIARFCKYAFANVYQKTIH
ncbi:hypothetical protein C9374_009487 [Naegleria lovaniensis]|uniref:Uncharacterized protein n=1 Tax=Naegleria lovaniensis TaxID=51637 RepID=A0AA88H134_NAELO|nr:uncharacterized protein C9374_009487 [Naegleria lovaniensis]KAG2392910.1 hypothetical protein C9374_009487 [Naegleria lovaniensis]